MVERASWRENYPMSRLNSWRSGGPARWLFTPAKIEQLGELSAQEERGNEPPLFIGHGTNLLVRDGGYDGIVVRTAPGLSDLRREADGRVYAAAGVGCPKLAKFCAEQGLAGGEFFSGIPGTVGGALAMNAGCYDGETWRVVSEVSVIHRGKQQTCQPDMFEVSYRRVLPVRVYAGAWFNFSNAQPAAVQKKLKELLKRRGDSQPLGKASAGSVFCNPPGDFAGRLIEQCGLKGERIGGACVSEKHANFIINDGKATAADIEELISLVRRQVADKTGVVLRTEVRIVGGRAA